MRRSIPVLIWLVGFLALWGCSKKKPTHPTYPTSILSAAQQQYFASEAVGNEVFVADFVGSFDSGFDNFIPDYRALNKMGQDSPTLGSPPDTSWRGPGSNPHQPGGTTWYYIHQDFNGSIFQHDTVYVMFTPDIWGTGQPPASRVDWETLIHEYAPTPQEIDEKDFAAWAKYSNNGSDTSKTDGNTKRIISVKMYGPVAKFTYQFSWTNCTRAGWKINPRTCSGSFTWTGSSYIGYDTTTTFNLTGSFTFSGGSGTGEAKYDMTFAKYVFNPDGTGYYTLLAESLNTHHPFNW